MVFTFLIIGIVLLIGCKVGVMFGLVFFFDVFKFVLFLLFILEGSGEFLWEVGWVELFVFVWLLIGGSGIVFLEL